MRRDFAFAFFIACTAAAGAQECPQVSVSSPSIDSEVRTLEGKLVFHNGIRQWFELKLDHPQCEQDSIQLVPKDDEGYPSLEVLRGCRVRSTAKLEVAGTGYFSLGMFQSVDEIEPVGGCERKPPFPDYSKSKPDPAIRHYRVDMRLDYVPGDHPISFRVSSGGKELRPWQAYASYSLTGLFVLYGQCGDGFEIDRVFGTPEVKPMHFDQDTAGDMAAFDPESAAVAGKTHLHLVYTCIRKPESENSLEDRWRRGGDSNPR